MMPRASRTAQQAVAWGRGQHRDLGAEWRALCLSFVRQSWGLPAVYGTANEAWRHARHKHAWSGNVDDIPYGAPVWSDKPGGSVFGHVFLAGGTTKTGRRIFWSNDIGVTGGISPVTIDAFTDRWGHRILGWAEDLNGYSLNLRDSAESSAADKRPKDVDIKDVPGWWVVDTDALNGRSRPSTTARITKRKHKRAKIKVDRAVHHENRLWLRSDKGTWFAASDEGDFTADYLKPRAGGRKK